MPGWGESDPATVDRLDHVDAAIRFLDALDIPRATFVGNSMGGQTSLPSTRTLDHPPGDHGAAGRSHAHPVRRR